MGERRAGSQPRLAAQQRRLVNDRSSCEPAQRKRAGTPEKRRGKPAPPLAALDRPATGELDGADGECGAVSRGRAAADARGPCVDAGGAGRERSSPRRARRRKAGEGATGKPASLRKVRARCGRGAGGSEGRSRLSSEASATKGGEVGRRRAADYRKGGKERRAVSVQRSSEAGASGNPDGLAQALSFLHAAIQTAHVRRATSRAEQFGAAHQGVAGRGRS